MPTRPERPHASPALLRAPLLACALGVLLAPACTRPPPAPLAVESPLARLLPSGVGAVYLTVVNPGEGEDRLLAAETPTARGVELHEVVKDGQVLRMEARPEGFPVPAGGRLELAPGGKHLMLLGVSDPEGAGPVRLTLRFARAGTVTVQVPRQSLAHETP